MPTRKAGASPDSLYKKAYAAAAASQINGHGGGHALSLCHIAQVLPLLRISHMATSNGSRHSGDEVYLRRLEGHTGAVGPAGVRPGEHRL
jgi:hypothetical protein